MEREIDMKQVSDGKLYGANDLVKVGCNDCQGCSDCCQGMGNSILLDPFDIWQLAGGGYPALEGLLREGRAELNVADGVILPNLKMCGEKEKCSFLNEQGRCGIHAFRPGFCRLFPLGRIYEGDSFRYFLQIHECSRTGGAKIKVKKWLQIPGTARYEQFVQDWHDLVKRLREQLKEGGDGERIREWNIRFLEIFYFLPYDGSQDFYKQFYGRQEEWQNGYGPRQVSRQ